MDKPEPIYLKQLLVGPMANYVYLIGDPKTHKAAVVDPAWDVDEIRRLAEADGYQIDKILITHYHPDHLGGRMMGQQIEGAAEILEKVKAKVYVNREEAPFSKRIAGLADSDMILVDSGDTAEIGNLTLKFIHTPGHTPGSQCFLVENSLISGDTLFVGSCGRVDLPGSNPEQMYYSLTQKLMALPEETILFPGHNYSKTSTSTIGEEKQSNPYFQFHSVKQFLSAMGYN